MESELDYELYYLVYLSSGSQFYFPHRHEIANSYLKELIAELKGNCNAGKKLKTVLDLLVCSNYYTFVLSRYFRQLEITNYYLRATLEKILNNSDDRYRYFAKYLFNLASLSFCEQDLLKLKLMDLESAKIAVVKPILDMKYLLKPVKFTHTSQDDVRSYSSSGISYLEDLFK